MLSSQFSQLDSSKISVPTSHMQNIFLANDSHQRLVKTSNKPCIRFIANPSLNILSDDESDRRDLCL